ncbi:hypothetical protein D3C71_1046470 [compost metagenome]
MRCAPNWVARRCVAGIAANDGARPPQHGWVPIERRIAAQRPFQSPIQLSDRRCDTGPDGANIARICNVGIAARKVKDERAGRLVVILRSIETELVFAALRAPAQLDTALAAVLGAPVGRLQHWQFNGGSIGGVAKVDAPASHIVLV